MKGKQLAIEISCGPICPACRCDTFDDWHHEKGLKWVGIALVGNMKCHNCGKFFSIHRYSDGAVHSTMWRKVA